MSKLKVEDNMPQFVRESELALDRALNRIAIDIERLSKMQVPHDKGQLKASGSHRRVGFLRYHVFYNKEYAHYQHEGGDGKRVVRRYSKPGKKKHFLIDPARQITSKAYNYFREELAFVRI